MTLKFYNTLSRKVEEFIPIKKGEVSMYTCGPTVYNYVHIGNLRCYIFNDLLRRYLKYKGFKLKHVMNITDVEDKTIRDSQKENKPFKEFTEFYTKAFLDDMKTLNIEIPEIMPKATEEIQGMVALIKILLDKGIAYKAKSGDIYFAISKFPGYGGLARIDLENLKKNADQRLDNADEYEKDDVRDFALWKAYDPEDGDVFWETEIGKGRPGWHIECSVMSSKYLGQPFDIHTGGVDLIFPHHTNEIAQSEAAYGIKFCNFFLHNDHLIVNGEKMSKSAGNFFTLRDLLEKGYDPIAIRYELLKTHYRQKLDFREDELKKVFEILQKFYDFLDKLAEIKKETSEVEGDIVDIMINTAKQEFEKALDDDLNISGAFAAVFDFMTGINKRMDDISKSDAVKIKSVMQSFDSILGIMHHEKGELEKDIEALIQKREDARKKKDFAAADKIRADLLAKGIILEDTPSGVRWKKK
jgi:cysteinyl-tRNA synthetase